MECNYIEGLMKRVHVEPICNCEKCPHDEEIDCPHDEEINCIKEYPAFTGDKQIALIKLVDGIYITEDEICYRIIIDSEYGDDPREAFYWSFSTFYGSLQPFEQALAQLILYVLDCKELQEKDVKEILERK